MIPTRRSWVPLPAVWYPVWITLDGGDATDALEAAILGMVHAGLEDFPGIARELFLPTPLVEAAGNALLNRALLTQDDSGAVRPAPGDSARSEVRTAASGWIAWDPRVNRPLRQIWLDARRPSRETFPLPDWEVLGVPDGPDGAHFDSTRVPEMRDVDGLLRLLPNAGELLVFRPFGSGVQLVDGARISRIRRKLDSRWERGPVWSPVEHRLSGPVVWRPSLIPVAEVLTELDPAGWDALVGAAKSLGPSLERLQRAAWNDVAPGVLKEAGFNSVEELRESARLTAERTLGTAWPEGWSSVRLAVHEAFIAEPLSQVVGADWRRSASGWADVLDAATAALMRGVFPLLHGIERLPTPGHDAERALRRILGPSYDHVAPVWQKAGELSQVRARVDSDVDSIGTRLIVLGIAIVLDRELRNSVERVENESPRFFDHLDKVVRERNRVVHHKMAGDPVDVGGFRARVIAVVRGFLQMVG